MRALFRLASICGLGCGLLFGSLKLCGGPVRFLPQFAKHPPDAERAFEKVSRKLAGWNSAIPTIPTSPMPNGTAGARAQPGGRPAKHTRREILNGVFYIVRSDSAVALAITSFPVPVSPWIKTAESTGATLPTSVSNARNFGLDPIKSK